MTTTAPRVVTDAGELAAWFAHGCRASQQQRRCGRTPGYPGPDGPRCSDHGGRVPNAPDERFIVHRAAQLRDGVQACSACEQVLLDDRHVTTPDGRAFVRRFNTGALVVHARFRGGAELLAPAPLTRLPDTDFRPCTPATGAHP